MADNNTQTMSDASDTKVNIFNIDGSIQEILDKLREEREKITKLFEQTRKAVALLADISSGQSEDGENYHNERFESAGVDLPFVLRTKILEQAKLIDQYAIKYSIKSGLSEQFINLDDRHTGAQAKLELLEDVETGIMSVIYNKINEIRSKIEADQQNEQASLGQLTEAPAKDDKK